MITLQTSLRSCFISQSIFSPLLMTPHNGSFPKHFPAKASAVSFLSDHGNGTPAPSRTGAEVPLRRMGSCPSIFRWLDGYLCFTPLLESDSSNFS
ncbi:hypothetical protein AVEN_118766-1 [Araneus ventricosus]|uniref:Uncharacterized protein n=1 Tax=Araneus ventricosus TaxID=182803 RepID=A0A4Y2BY37_ARAVE|nr:hypothetical protein AVEN_118766-1 [Araneus ventricosus]